jgi:hypothetical protein
MTVAAITVALAFAILGTFAARSYRDGVGGWDMSGSELRNAVIVQFAHLLQAFGIAMIVMSSAAAIVLYFALPTAFTILGSSVPWLHAHVQPWVDFNAAQSPLQNGETPFQSSDIVSATEWARLGVTAAMWVALPLALGVRRLLRSEIK